MWVSVTGKGKPEQPPAVDEDTEEGRNGDKPAALFPKPRFVFTIYTPNRVTLNNELLDPGSATQEVWKGCTIGGSSTVVKPTVGGEEPQGAKIKKYVKMNSLVIKMLNRLIRDTIIQREAIQYSPGEKFVLVQILVAAAVIPTLVMKCERIGVGNVVGQCYVTPLETSLLPSPGPIQLLEDSSILISTPKGPQQGIDPAKEADDEADETEAVSSDEEDDAPEDVSADPSSFAVKSIGVPFLSKTRREELKKEIKQARKEWLATGARIRVEQVAEQIIANAAFTWDYTAFVMCAASIAAIGLGTNSSVSVIASMLISPIMGPVLSFTFGTTLRNRSMIMTGLRNELISLALCVLTGLIWGLVAAFANVDERRNWPSDEMTSRGDVTGLLSGIAVALISGVATALSTLGNNSSGMTGVAISLSLLPPAVNAGMCWMFAILVATGAVERNAGDNEQYWELGTVSFGLTMANIVCIWLTGVFTFWLKEVCIQICDDLLLEIHSYQASFPFRFLPTRRRTHFGRVISTSTGRTQRQSRLLIPTKSMMVSRP
jgi:uncharacterized hydrophobic protein (TIGR00271 family)